MSASRFLTACAVQAPPRAVFTPRITSSRAIVFISRTSAGREAAKQRGVRFGRPPALTPDQVALGRRLVNEGTSVRAAAKVLRCHHATLTGHSMPQEVRRSRPADLQG